MLNPYTPLQPLESDANETAPIVRLVLGALAFVASAFVVWIMLIGLFCRDTSEYWPACVAALPRIGVWAAGLQDCVAAWCECLFDGLYRFHQLTFVVAVDRVSPCARRESRSADPNPHPAGFRQPTAVTFFSVASILCAFMSFVTTKHRPSRGARAIAVVAATLSGIYLIAWAVGCFWFLGSRG